MTNNRRAKQERTSDKRRPQEKLRLLIEAAKLSDEELGTFLRREGIHGADLGHWHEAAIEGLSGKAAAVATVGQANKRVRGLEKELRRKEKALAEAGALLVLQKKARQIWGGEDDDT